MESIKLEKSTNPSPMIKLLNAHSMLSQYCPSRSFRCGGCVVGQPGFHMETIKSSRSVLILFTWSCWVTLFRCCFNTVLPDRFDTDAVLLVNIVSTWKPWSRTGLHSSWLHDIVEWSFFNTVSILFFQIVSIRMLCCLSTSFPHGNHEVEQVGTYPVFMILLSGLVSILFRYRQLGAQFLVCLTTSVQGCFHAALTG